MRETFTRRPYMLLSMLSRAPTQNRRSRCTYRVDCTGDGYLSDLIPDSDADAWNSKLDSDTKAFDHDKDVWDTAQDQLLRHLLSEALTKADVDQIFGKKKKKSRNKRKRYMAERESQRH